MRDEERTVAPFDFAIEPMLAFAQCDFGIAIERLAIESLLDIFLSLLIFIHFPLPVSGAVAGLRVRSEF